MTVTRDRRLLTFERAGQVYGVDARDFGVTADGVTDDATAMQAAIDHVTDAGGGVVRLGHGTHLIGATLTWPTGVFVGMQGEGRVFVGGARGTSLKRAATLTDHLILAEGTGQGAGERTHWWFADMEIHGGDVAAPLARLARASESGLRNVRFSSALDTLLDAAEWWNCRAEYVYFVRGGSGRTKPAVLVTSPGGTGGASNTVHFVGAEWETNTGTDLRITGNDGASQDWTVGVLMSNIKMERDTGDYPLIDVDRGGAIQVGDFFLHLGPDATAPHVEMKGTAPIPSRPVSFSNGTISASKWDGTSETDEAAVPYFIDATEGTLQLANVGMNGDPTTAFVHIGSGVGINDVTMHGVTVPDRSKLLHDERPGSLFGYGSIPLVPAIEGVAASSSVNRVIWALPDGSGGTLTYANVPVPPDAATGRPIRMRVLWYSDAATGAIRWQVGMKNLAESGEDITIAQADVAQTVTVPATANRTTITEFTSPWSITASTRWLALRLQRVASDAGDTCTGSGRVLGVEVIYERTL